MKKNVSVLGLDIGGTKISSGLNREGNVYARKEIGTPYKSSQQEILEAIADHISGYDAHGISAIGIGIPGLVDAQKGIVYNLANIPSFKRVNLKDYLEDRFKVPVFINNDANCFTLGEYKFGPAKVHEHVVGITLGTGIGTGVIANSSLYTGHVCGAGEWGGVPYLDKSFEDYCSNKFFKSVAGESAKTLAKRAAENDKEALMLFEKFGEHLGRLINSVLFTFSPQAVVLGGSIRKAYPFFKEAMYKTVETFPYREITTSLKIYVSELGDSAILGAIALADESEVAFSDRQIDEVPER